MKKYLFYFLTLPLMCCLLAACGDDDEEKSKESIIELSAEDFTDDGFFDGTLYYQRISEVPMYARVNKASMWCQTVTIPSKVKIEKDVYTIVEIGEAAFQFSDLTSVTIPNSVKIISESAFEDCTALTSITIPNSVTEIGGWAFQGCTSLEKVNCKWKNPPLLASNYNDGPIAYFDATTYKTAKLYVPKGTKKAYQETYPWNLFDTIVEEK